MRLLGTAEPRGGADEHGGARTGHRSWGVLPVRHLACLQGTQCTLKPRSGGLEQLVTNLSSLRFSASVKPSTTLQNTLMTGCSAE